MSQVFRVLCCYSCETFQVDQVKKSKKWQCKICSEKQSLKKAFKIGAARDCRNLVQALNMQRSSIQRNIPSSNEVSDDDDENSTCSIENSFDNIEDVEQPVFDAGNQDESLCELYANAEFDSSIQHQTKGHASVLHNKRLESGLYTPVAEQEQSVQEDKDSIKENTFADPNDVHDEPQLAKGKDSRKRSFGCFANSTSSPLKKKNRGFLLIKNAASKIKV